MKHGMDVASIAALFADGRAWVSIGVVAEDVIDFDEDDYKQPFVGVTMQPAGVEINCRVASAAAGNGEADWVPFVKGDEVVVVLPGGAEAAGPIIIGRLNNAVDPFPTSVAGQPTKDNKFAFRRMRSPYILEAAGGILIRQAITTAFLSLDATGGAQLANGDGHYVAVKSDFLGFGTKDNDLLLQLDLTNKVLKAEVGPNTVLQLAKEGVSMLATAGELHIGASGAPTNKHAIGVEQVLVILQAFFTAIGVALPGALTGAGLAGATVAALNVALPAATLLPITPYNTTLAGALQVPPDPLGIKPGVGSAALLIG